MIKISIVCMIMLAFPSVAHSEMFGFGDKSKSEEALKEAESRATKAELEVWELQRSMSQAVETVRYNTQFARGSLNQMSRRPGTELDINAKDDLSHAYRSLSDMETAMNRLESKIKPGKRLGAGPDTMYRRNDMNLILNDGKVTPEEFDDL